MGTYVNCVLNNPLENDRVNVLEQCKAAELWDAILGKRAILLSVIEDNALHSGNASRGQSFQTDDLRPAISV